MVGRTAPAIDPRRVGRWSILGPLVALLLALMGQDVSAADAQQGRASGLRGTLVGRLLEKSPDLLRSYEAKIVAATTENGIDAAALRRSPTFLAVRALVALSDRRTGEAERHAADLLTFREDRKAGIFFVFRWDYTARWPYKLRAPWVSAITQGYALAVFQALEKATGNAKYKDIAAGIRRSYGISVADGGFARGVADGMLFEEYPMPQSTAVLNGAMVAALALIDYESAHASEGGSALVGAVKSWFEANIGRYDVTEPRYPAPVPAYSLAPRRSEVLFRFVGAPARVAEVVLTSKGGVPRVLAVGKDGDDDPNALQFVWFNPRFQNWGRAEKADGGATRRILPKQGSYDHAPFTYAFEGAIPAGEWTLTVRAENLSSQPLAVQGSDGAEYYQFGVIAPGTKLGSPQEFHVGEAFTRSVIAHDTRSMPSVEPAYFADTPILLDILADALHSARLAEYAERWKGAGAFEPSRYLVTKPLPLFVDHRENPVLGLRPGEESVSVEYPALIEKDGMWYMFYSAYGDDKRWRILLAVSSDHGATWRREGNVFSEANLGIRGNYAFPAIIEDRPRHRYLMYFSADVGNSGKYERILVASSPTLYGWKLLGPVAEVGGLRPVVWQSGADIKVLFAVVLGATQDLMLMTSRDGTTFTRPRIVYSTYAVDGSGLYTAARLPLPGYDLFALNTTFDKDRRDTLLLCEQNDGRLTEALDAPIDTERPTPDRWDQFRYGMTFLRDGERIRMFYNGIKHDGTDGAGLIGEARVDLGMLATLAVSPACKRR